MRVLVTGGAGFIGSHLVDMLLAAGHDVAVLDNFTSGSRDNLKAAATAAQRPGAPDLRVFTGTVTWRPDVTKAMENFPPDVVYHLAAQVDVGTSAEHPKVDAETNVIGTVNMLEAAKLVGVRRFVFVSSAAMFGDDGQPLSLRAGEAGFRPAPVSPYGASKAAAGLYVDLYGRSAAGGGLGMACSTVVFPNVYGPRQRPDRGAVSIFIRALLRGEPVTLRGDGGNVRDYLFVFDAARALMWAGNCLKADGSGTGLAHGRALVGTGVGTTDAGLVMLTAHAVVEVAGPRVIPAGESVPQGVIHGPASSADVRRCVFPPSRSGMVRTTLADGLRVTVQAIREELGV